MEKYRCKIIGKNAYVGNKKIGPVFVATSEDGRITVVGIRIRYKNPVFVSVSSENHNKVDININPQNTEICFGMGHAIRHDHDKNDPDFAIHLAIKRILNEHRFLYSNSYSMLNNDRCQAIVENERDYIKNHLSDYLKEYM